MGGKEHSKSEDLAREQGCEWYTVQLEGGRSRAVQENAPQSKTIEGFLQRKGGGVGCFGSGKADSRYRRRADLEEEK